MNGHCTVCQGTRLVCCYIISCFVPQKVTEGCPVVCQEGFGGFFGASSGLWKILLIFVMLEPLENLRRTFGECSHLGSHYHFSSSPSCYSLEGGNIYASQSKKVDKSVLIFTFSFLLAVEFEQSCYNITAERAEALISAV